MIARERRLSPSAWLRPEGDSVTAVVGGREETVRIRRHDQTLFVHGSPWRAHADGHSLPDLHQRGRRDERRTACPDDGHDPQGQRRGWRPVKAGDVVAVLKSMKMELRIAARSMACGDGELPTGDMVERNAVVVSWKRRAIARREVTTCDWERQLRNRGRVALLTLDEPRQAQCADRRHSRRNSRWTEERRTRMRPCGWP